MARGFATRPKASDYLAALHGRVGRLRGGTGAPSSPFQYPFYRGRRMRGGKVGGKRKRRRITGEGVGDVLRAVWPAIKRIPALFRSRAARKLAGTIAKTGVAAGLNVAMDKLRDKTVPLREVAKKRGREAVSELLDKASAKVRGGRRRRRRGVRRRRRKRTAAIKGGKRRRRCCKKKIRRKRRAKSKDIFDN
jgi:hypothetical protein